MVGDEVTANSLLFRDHADRVRFLKQLAERREQHRIRLFLFACMTNHFHLVFETPLANCSQFMQSLTTAYTVYYNLRHHRHGHVLDGRFKAKMVEGDAYLLTLSRYVHLNPVRVGTLRERPLAEQITALRSYPWSSYPSYIGHRPPLDFVDYGPLLSQMEGPRLQWSRRYRAFVENGLVAPDREIQAALRCSPHCIGGDAFRTWVDDLYAQRLARHTRPEDVSFRQMTPPLPAETVLQTLTQAFKADAADFKRRQHDSPLRAIAAHFLVRYAGLSQRAAGDFLHIGSGSAVNNQLQRWNDRMLQDPRLSRLIGKARERLEAATPRRPAGSDKQPGSGSRWRKV